MIKHITQPMKVIDNFFEQPQLVVKHAIKQEYVDQDNSLFLGTRSTTLDMIDIDMFEGCLSYPGINLQISRPNKITARWLDHQGSDRSFVLDGYSARCFMHEMDHLNGITMDEHVSPRVWKEAMAKAGHVS